MKEINILIPKKLYIPEKGVECQIDAMFCPITRNQELCRCLPCDSCVYVYELRRKK